MDVAVFSTRSYDRQFLDLANAPAGNSHALRYFDAGLSEQTMALAAGSDAICAFVNDRLNRGVLAALHGQGTRLIALRCAGFNHVDLEAAEALEIAVALILSLNRKLHRAYVRVREGAMLINTSRGAWIYVAAR